MNKPDACQPLCPQFSFLHTHMPCLSLCVRKGVEADVNAAIISHELAHVVY